MEGFWKWIDISTISPSPLLSSLSFEAGGLFLGVGVWVERPGCRVPVNSVRGGWIKE